jgi:hypothetical protein
MTVSSFRYKMAVEVDTSLHRGGDMVPRMSGTGAPNSSRALSGTRGTKIPVQHNELKKLKVI